MSGNLTRDKNYPDHYIHQLIQGDKIPIAKLKASDYLKALDTVKFDQTIRIDENTSVKRCGLWTERVEIRARNTFAEIKMSNLPAEIKSLEESLTRILNARGESK